MPKKALCLAVAILLSSCAKQQKQEISKFTPDGSLKPTVAIVPVIDNSHSGLPWSVGEEFTLSITDNVTKKNKLYLQDTTSVHAITEQLREINNPFGGDIRWIKSTFASNQFVVFLELLDHQEEALHKDSTTGPAELHMSMRVRIFDLTRETPRVILQEIVQEDHYIPKFFTRNLSYQPDWNQDGYNISPMGMAHAEFSQHIAKRIQHYISLHNPS